MKQALNMKNIKEGEICVPIDKLSSPNRKNFTAQSRSPFYVNEQLSKPQTDTQWLLSLNEIAISFREVKQRRR